MSRVSTPTCPYVTGKSVELGPGYTRRSARCRATNTVTGIGPRPARLLACPFRQRPSDILQNTDSWTDRATSTAGRRTDTDLLRPHRLPPCGPSPRPFRRRPSDSPTGTASNTDSRPRRRPTRPVL